MAQALLRSLAFALGVLALAPAAHAQLSAVRIASGLPAPIFAAAPPGDPRLFIVLRGGEIVIRSQGAILPTPFLSIDVDTSGEGGLLGLAFAPDYATSGVFYVYYTAEDASAPLESRVSRFTVEGDPATSNDADETEEEVIFRLDQPYDNHNGGTLAIRDGYLYLGLGDGGDGGDPADRAQDDGSLFGKLLRLDLAIPSPDNDDWEVYAKGLRNPFRFGFDAETKDLYIGDVGQGVFEEIDVTPALAAPGLNYGWDVEEGSHCYEPEVGKPPCEDASLVRPVFEYGHSGSFCGGSVTGGAVYRGAAYPSLEGRYFFADYCKDYLWSFRWNPLTGAYEDLIEHTDAIVADTGSIEDVVAIAEDGAGELYFVDLGGEVFRLVPEPGAAAACAAALAALAVRARAGRRRVRSSPAP